jgi:hypothetical protein
MSRTLPCVGALLLAGCYYHGSAGYSDALSSNPGRRGAAANAHAGILGEEGGVGAALRTKASGRAQQAGLGLEVALYLPSSTRRDVEPFAFGGGQLVEMGHVDGELAFAALSPFVELGLKLPGPDESGFTVGAAVDYSLRLGEAPREAYYSLLVGFGAFRPLRSSRK